MRTRRLLLNRPLTETEKETHTFFLPASYPAGFMEDHTLSQMTAALTTLTLPVPPMFEDALGYPSDARWVAFYWTPAGDELRYDDGTMSAEGSWSAGHLFVHHPRIAPALQSYQFGSSEEEPTHWLLLDRMARTLSVGMVADV